MSDPNQYDVDLIRQMTPGLVLLARQWCDSPEDVVQNAFLKLFRHSLPPDNVAAWMYRVVRNEAINETRSRVRREQREGRVVAESKPWFEESNRLEDQLDAQATANALASLAIDDREPIVMRIWGGLSFEEIGVVLKCSASTAARRYRSGLESIRNKLASSHVEGLR